MVFSSYSSHAMIQDVHLIVFLIVLNNQSNIKGNLVSKVRASAEAIAYKKAAATKAPATIPAPTLLAEAAPV